MLGIYVHVPFCRHKCAYCSFKTEVPARGEMPAYLEALRREAAWWGARVDQPVGSLFLGGGTPSLMGAEGMGRMLETLRAGFGWSEDAEVTSEMNPESATADVLRIGREMGVNRISLGVQSFNDTILRGIDRIHDADGARRAVERVRQAGFDNLSIDLIFGTPGQTLAIWEADLDAALALETEHISLYGLTVDEGTPLEDRVAAGAVAVADDDLSAAMYETAIDRLEGAGFVHYEISNFARPGRSSHHNRNYWLHGEYLGLGPAAHSHWGGERWRNPDALGDYLRVWRESEPGDGFREEVEAVTPARRISDTLILGLRMREGVAWPVDLNELGDQDREAIRRGVERRLGEGLLEIDGQRLRLTRTGILLSNEVFQDLLPASGGEVESHGRVG